jgi:hypothetical protein
VKNISKLRKNALPGFLRKGPREVRGGFDHREGPRKGPSHCDQPKKGHQRLIVTGVTLEHWAHNSFV